MTFSFWCGFLVNTGITMAHQDWYGLEGFIVYLQSHWIDLHWLVGASLAFVAVWIYMGRRLRILNYLSKESSKVRLP